MFIVGVVADSFVMGKALAILVTSLRLSEVSEIEKRRWERYGLRFHVYVKWTDLSGNVMEIAGTTRDISASVICMWCEGLVQQGAEVNLEIELPIVLEGTEDSRIAARGTVVRNESIRDPYKGYELGIMFDCTYP